MLQDTQSSTTCVLQNIAHPPCIGEVTIVSSLAVNLGGGWNTGVDGEAAAPGSFGDMLMDVEAGVGWGHAVAWSPSGKPQTEPYGICLCDKMNSGTLSFLTSAPVAVVDMQCSESSIIADVTRMHLAIQMPGSPIAQHWQCWPNVLISCAAAAT